MCENKSHHGSQEHCSTYIDSLQPRIFLTCWVNGEIISAQIDPMITLLNFLRQDLKLLGTKEGCGEGECGACTIIMNGEAVNACLILALEAQDAEITTVEGLSRGGQLSLLQSEFIRQDALQCGFCTPGMLMSARALLDRTLNPTEPEIKEAIAGNLCRCTGYSPIIAAISSTAKKEREERE